ncbi:MAG: RNA polymerase sigma factor [Mangrovibacterium sp.]
MFGAWLKRIVINHSIDYLRKNKLDTEKIEEVKFEGKEDLDIYIEINYEKLHEALALLPDNHRVVFTLFVLEGYDHEEIAEILRINYNTSRSHLARAKAKLRQLLQKEALTSV